MNPVGLVSHDHNVPALGKRLAGLLKFLHSGEDNAVFEGIFERERLLDIIKNFICFSNEGLKQFKILAGVIVRIFVIHKVDKAGTFLTPRKIAHFNAMLDMIHKHLDIPISTAPMWNGIFTVRSTRRNLPPLCIG